MARRSTHALSPTDSNAPEPQPLTPMKHLHSRRDDSGERGGVKPMVLLWALGIPIPLILLILLFKGCV